MKAFIVKSGALVLGFVVGTLGGTDLISWFVELVTKAGVFFGA